jgi:transcriptional regulator with XRE-family HTH domain
MLNLGSTAVKASERTKTDTPARQALCAWLAAPRRGRMQKRLAKILGVNAGAVSEWTRGLSRPTVARALFLWKLCGIPVDAWCTDKELRELGRMEFEAHKLAQEPDVESAEERKQRLADRQTTMPFLQPTGTS